MILEDGEFAFRSRNDHGFDFPEKTSFSGETSSK